MPRTWILDRLRELGLKQAALAALVGVWESTIERWIAGTHTPPPGSKNRRALARALELPIETVDALFAEGPGTAQPLAARAPSCLRPARVAEALTIVTADEADTLTAACDHLDELVSYYTHAVGAASSRVLYDELLEIRSWAGKMVRRCKSGSPRRADLVISSGWLSNILATAANYAGDHGAALVWCRDAERRGAEGSLPDLAGWAWLIRAIIAYYQGRAEHSSEIARNGQRIAPRGSPSHAKLAAQEMRSRAMLADTAGMASAKERAVRAMACIPPSTPTSGAFGIRRSDSTDPPFTATSLLLTNDFASAAAATRRVLEEYGPLTGDQRLPSSYARSQLILALAEAGLGHADEAVAAGQAALTDANLVWSTVVLAGQLDEVLKQRFPGAVETAAFQADYAAATEQLNYRLPLSSSAKG